MSKIQLGVCLITAALSGCSSQPPEAIPPELEALITTPPSEPVRPDLPALPPTEAVLTNQAPDVQSPDFASSTATKPQIRGQSARQMYQALSERPPAESRQLHFHLGSQTFDYLENGELFLSGPIASGKPASPTPAGKFSVLSKVKDKESSRYTNEIGTQAWMPYSLQFHGNYFIHEGWLPGYAASHGCIRLGHYHARLLFERMKVGDPVIVSN
jgi:lipoprotein-anchoring transpeptidase ErfK/SrfK